MLRLFDTRTHQVAPIEPAHRGRLRIYTCGPTTYRPAHIGDLRSYLLPDLIRRTAERAQLLVTRCQNITDVRLADAMSLPRTAMSLPRTAMSPARTPRGSMRRRSAPTAPR